MRKNLFLTTLLMLATSFAAANDMVTYWWHSSLLPPADNKCQSNIHNICSNAEGNAFVLGNFGSINATDETTFLGQTFTGAEYGVSSGYNLNLVFAKVDSLGKPLWTIHSTEGNFSSGTFCPARDGGAVLAVKFRLTEKNKQDGAKNPYIALQDATGKVQSLETTYQGTNYQYVVLVRVDVNGAITHFIPLWTSHAVAPHNKDGKPTPDVADITAIMEDEDGNLYLQGGQAMDIALGTDTIRARKNPDWDGNSFSDNGNSFIIKTDAQFRYLSHTTTDGNVLYDRFMLAAYHDGNIVLVGHAKVDSLGGTLQWGKQQLNLRDRCIVTARLDRNLACTQLHAIQQVRINNMSGMFKQLAWSEDSTTLYFTGALNGGLVWQGDTLASGNMARGQKNDGLLVQIDAATAEPRNLALLHSDILNVNIGATMLNDTLYILNYQFGTDISLLCYDSKLQYLGRSALATGGGSLSALGIARCNRQLWIGMRSRGGIDFNVGSETIAYTPLWYATLSGWQLNGGVSSGISTPSANTTDKSRKVIIDGKLYIRRGSQLFNALGQPL